MNVIFILLDDLGWNDVGPHNNKVLTPNGKNHWCFLINSYKFIKLKKKISYIGSSSNPDPNRHLEDYYIKQEDYKEDNDNDEENIKYMECYDLINYQEEKII